MHTSTVASDRPCIYLVKEKQWINEFLSLPATSVNLPQPHNQIQQDAGSLEEAQDQSDQNFAQGMAGLGPSTVTVQHSLVFPRAIAEQTDVGAGHAQCTCCKYSRCCLNSVILKLPPGVWWLCSDRLMPAFHTMHHELSGIHFPAVLNGHYRYHPRVPLF